MKKHTYKKNIRRFSILILLVCFFAFSTISPLTVTAHAFNGSTSQRFGAWVAAAITALNINLQAITATPVDMVNYISDPLNIAYTYTDEYLDNYFNQSVIEIHPGGTTIDGVTYDDIWLSSDASEIFRTNAFDFVTANSIASNTNGTFATGAGDILGLPAFTISGQTRTQNYTFPADFTGSLPITNSLALYRTGNLYGFTINGSNYQIGSNATRDLPGSFYLYPNGYHISHNGGSKTVANYNIAFTSEPFDFDYVSGTIPIDAPLSTDEGLIIHVPPHPGTSWSQFKEDNPEFLQPGGVQVDVDTDPDIYDKLGDLADILAPIIPIIIAEYNEYSPGPVTETTIADTNYSILESALDRIHTALETVGNTITGIKDAILEDIEIGPIRVFDKALDLISSIFSPVFLFIRTNLSIWSYVVSWLNSISAPFTFILNAVSNTSIMIPIYACVAGTLCIAIYRRFGK